MDRKETVDTLDLVSKALSRTSLIPILQCFAFDGETVRASDDTVAIVAPCKTKEQFAAHGNTLLGLLKHSSAKELEINIEEQDVIIKAARSTFKLPWFPIEDYLFTEPEDKWAAEIAISEDLIAGITACVVTSSRDNSQPALLGVSLNGNKLYSSDSDAISEYVLEDKIKGKEPYMMPNVFCEALLSVVEELEITAGTLELNKDWARATLEDGYVIYGRMIENDNPLDFAGQIEKTVKGELTFVEAPKGLDNALSRARVVADAETAKTVVTIEGGRMKLLTQTSMGIIRDSLAIADHEDVVANINAALMQRSLKLCNEMTVREGFCCFKSNKLLVLTGNM